MKKLIWTYSTFLALLPLFYVLHHNNELFGFITFSESVIALLVCGVFVSLIYLLSKSAVFTFLLSIFMLYFGVIHDFLKTSTNPFLGSYKIVVPVLIFLILFLTWYWKRSPSRLKKVSVYLNLLMIFFVLIEIVALGINYSKYASNKNLIQPRNGICGNFQSTSDTTRPDIYFIVLDAYTNNTTLKELWNFNNDSFMNFLRSRGFYTAELSRSNYNFTPFSISSTLNMDYLPKEVGNRGNVPGLMLRGVNSMSDNETFCILKKLGYDIRIFAPFHSKIEDIGLYKEFSDFGEKQLYNQTFPKRFQRDIAWNFMKRSKTPEEDPAYKNFVRRAADIQATIDRVKSFTPSAVKPKLVYAHLMITHQPHLFDSTGNLRKGRDLVRQDNLFDTYTDQVNYANKVIEQLVVHIQTFNKKNTIIIIEGDHGFRDLPNNRKDHQFPNLNAIYFPQQDYHEFYQKMSPVNTFRMVFNHYFGQNLPLLKDSSVFVNY